jgi:hypothetical protein
MDRLGRPNPHAALTAARMRAGSGSAPHRFRPRDQIVVGAFFRYDAVLQHDNLVGIADGAQAVRYHDGPFDPSLNAAALRLQRALIPCRAPP